MNSRIFFMFLALFAALPGFSQSASPRIVSITGPSSSCDVTSTYVISVRNANEVVITVQGGTMAFPVPPSACGVAASGNNSPSGVSTVTLFFPVNPSLCTAFTVSVDVTWSAPSGQVSARARNTILNQLSALVTRSHTRIPRVFGPPVINGQVCVSGDMLQFSSSGPLGASISWAALPSSLLVGTPTLASTQIWGFAPGQSATVTATYSCPGLPPQSTSFVFSTLGGDGCADIYRASPGGTGTVPALGRDVALPPKGGGAMGIAVSPNPLPPGSSALLALPGLEGPTNIQVIDAMGRQVLSLRGHGSYVELPTGGLAPGYYVVRYVSGGTSGALPLIVSNGG